MRFTASRSAAMKSMYAESVRTCLGLAASSALHFLGDDGASTDALGPGTPPLGPGAPPLCPRACSSRSKAAFSVRHLLRFSNILATTLAWLASAVIGLRDAWGECGTLQRSVRPRGRVLRVSGVCTRSEVDRVGAEDDFERTAKRDWTRRGIRAWRRSWSAGFPPSSSEARRSRSVGSTMARKVRVEPDYGSLRGTVARDGGGGRQGAADGG